ncbi:unnamed protein product [Prunus armeniaca]
MTSDGAMSAATVGNFNLPKHCDNNEVLKALCLQAGWTIEDDDTTYRKGLKPTQIDTPSTSTMINPYSSLNPSPISSYQASLSSSSYPSPSRFDPSIIHPIPFTICAINPNQIPNWDSIAKQSMASFNYPFYAIYTLASPTSHQIHFPAATIPECDESDTSAVDSRQWVFF